MTPDDKTEFAMVLTGMAAVHGRELTPEAVVFWWDCFQDWPIADFKAAAHKLARASTFMPKPGDFEKLRRAGEETPAEIWASISKWLVYSPNGYTLSAHTPRLIAKCIEAAGGADAIAMKPLTERHWMEKRFAEHYEQLREATEGRESLPQIATVAKLLSMRPK